jgi:heptosyltransferase II
MTMTVEEADTRSLILKLGSIGDVVATIPAAWMLHRKSGTHIDWLCGPAVAPLLSCYKWIRPIVVNDARLIGGSRIQSIAEVIRTWSKLKGTSYELCATLQYDRRYRLLTLPVRSKKKVAMDWDIRERQLISERHHSAEYARILCGLEDTHRAENVAPLAPDVLPENPVPIGAKKRIALAPGGARNLLRDDPLRRWPVAEYVKLTKLLVDQGYEVILTGGPTDKWVEQEFSSLPVHSYVGLWSIPETLAFYNSCDCVITHDSGPMHLAGLMDCSLVALFGPTAASKALPRRDRVVGLWGGEKLPCRPCYDGREYAPCSWNGCMAMIRPEYVASIVETLVVSPASEWQIYSM